MAKLHQQMRKPKNPAHGSVAKLVDDSYAVSFSRSSEGAGSYCDKKCRLWDLCYASKLEKMPTRKSLRDMLERRADMAIEIIEASIKWMPRDFSWMRWSVFGSVPSKKQLGTKWNKWAKLFRKANEQALDSGADIHLPVESMEKAKDYRKALHGLPIVVRRSDQSETLAGVLQSTDARSWVAGEVKWRYTDLAKAENERKGLEAVRAIRAAGQTAVKCPYPRLKCGTCRACSHPSVDVVVYVAH